MNLDTYSRIHLEWMFENQPELVRELHNSNKLEEHLEDKMNQALNLVDLFEQSGQHREEAWENATALVLAPADGPAFSDDPPDPLPLAEQEAIYKRLEANESGRQRIANA